VEARVDSIRRPNECPRCGRAYSALNLPRPPRRSPDEIRSLKTALTPAWQCRCGAWLRTKPRSYGWLDIAAIVVLATIQLFVAVRFWWARVGFVYFLPIGLWFAYRSSRPMTVEEVPAPDEARREIA
jgi:hypothetical protein